MTKSTSKATDTHPRNWSSKIREGIVASIDEQIAEVIRSLPAEYFDALSEEDQLEHIRALVALRVCDIEQDVMLRQSDGRRVTVVSQQNYAGLLAELIDRVPDEGELVGAQVFSSRNKEFVIDIFDFQTAEQLTPGSQTDAGHYAELGDVVEQSTGAQREDIDRFLESYDANSAHLNSPAEVVKQFAAFKSVQDNDSDLSVLWDVVADRGGEEQKRFAKVIVCAENSSTRFVFQRVADFFARYQIDIERAFCRNLRLAQGSTAALLTFQICIENEAFDAVRQQVGDCSPDLDGDVLRARLVSFLQLDQEVIAPISEINSTPIDLLGTILEGELFCGLARLTHYAIGFRRGLEISREQVFVRLLRYQAIVSEILTAFLSRFSDDGNNETGPADIGLDSIVDVTDKTILKTFRELAQCIQRCNLNLPDRRSLAFRLPGELFENEERGERPFAIFYVYGRGFDAFHVRFRDVARGGVRIVRTRSHAHYLFESTRVYDEVYRLASAQQLKNKDIAEGGAKAVMVLKPNSHLERAGHDFVEGLLDLTTQIDATTPIDLEPANSEFLYLGPDENVTNQLIDWIVQRAEKRGYPIPQTIMSSKPDTGINHKEFGVTSEGVVVFLHHALLEVGIDPRQQNFTVTMTGGPDGDVGGNAIRILIREYGEHFHLVGIADGTGAAHDPNGLDHSELLRLVDSGLGIAHFNSDRLSDAGKIYDLSSDDSVAFRNRLHFIVAADLFLPAGGRPSTINENNWHYYFDKDQRPNSKVIVEGANLFITETARHKLSQAGVMIVKDSSANKCGVICSSLEIISGMLVSSKDFQEIKSDYVDDVLKLLRSLASIEAISLFNESARQPEKTLPEISVELSQQIIRIADITIDSMPLWSNADQEKANQIILGFLPKSLVQLLDSASLNEIPGVYRNQLFAAIISSRIVYREGVRNLNEMKQAALSKLVQEQMTSELEVQKIIRDLELSSVEDRQRIISILDHAGARAQRELRI
ncbi:MAG: NAD-glutamate dehydrogenase domain-containing protein [Planctomycetota bacterium]